MTDHNNEWKRIGGSWTYFSPAKNWLWEASIISEVENSKKDDGGVGLGGELWCVSLEFPLALPYRYFLETPFGQLQAWGKK